MQDKYNHFRPWFYAAALYNFIWGLTNIFFPALVFQFWDLRLPQDIAFWRAIGMFVLVYTPAYWWAARRPRYYRVAFIQTACPDSSDTTDVDLRISHPIFGEVFGYQGTFKVARYRNSIPLENWE